ncbi:MAG: hypothetical protein CVV27_17710 [Candidatus Melainabacteria bacterium HGW-Melainabacteria-1]|nr:MAG: hypothetical protein CVV27_17710 [Candidatus Melainabacteria bacterium HGW-Melainabacteria-1]
MSAQQLDHNVPWPQRWGIYLREMFQPGSRLLFATLTSLGLGWGVLADQDATALTFDGRLLLASGSLFLILLYYRLCDEFKDLDTDREFFPDRPLPSGRVLLTDLRAMQLTATGLGFGLNLLWPLAPLAFACLWVYAWLMGKWFFLPELIGGNRLLAFVTHGPISLVGSYYVMALYLQPGQALFSLQSALLALWFALPGFSWEVARKTRAPQHEARGYQIYSSMLGYRGAAALPPLFALVELAIGIWLSQQLSLPGWFIPALSLVSLAYLLPFGRFMAAPERFEAWLKPASEAYTGLLLVMLPLALGLSHTVQWSF